MLITTQSILNVKKGQTITCVCLPTHFIIHIHLKLLNYKKAKLDGTEVAESKCLASLLPDVYIRNVKAEIPVSDIQRKSPNLHNLNQKLMLFTLKLHYIPREIYIFQCPASFIQVFKTFEFFQNFIKL